MRARTIVALVCLGLAQAACDSEVSVTNPYDPEAPLDAQVKGHIVGQVVAEAAFGPESLTLTVDGRSIGGTSLEVPVDPSAFEVVDERTVRFRVDAPAGTYRVQASVPGFASRAIFGVEVGIDEEVDVGTIVLTVGRGILEGTILARSPTGEDAAAPADTKVTLIRLAGAYSPDPGSTECQPPGEEEIVTARVFADGTFRGTGLAVGEYLVVAEREGYVPAVAPKSVSVKAEETTDAGSLVLLSADGILRLVPSLDPNADPAAGVTRSLALTVEVTPPPVFNAMEISEDSTFADASLGDTEFGAVESSLSWTLPPGEGQRTLYLRFRAPTCALSPVFAGSVVVDTTPPEASPPALKTGASCTNQSLATVRLTAADPCAEGACGGLYQMRLSSDGALDDEPWIPYELERTLDLGSSDGEIPVVWAVRDRAGNESAEVASSITLNTTGPTLGSPALQVDGGGSTVRSLGVRLVFDVSGADEVEVGNASGLDGSGWQPLPQTRQLEWRLADGPDGPRQVVARFRDACGNVTPEVDLVLDLDRSGLLQGSARLEGATTDYSGITVSLWQEDPATGTYVDTGISTITGSSGAWVLTGLSAGTYRLDFSLSGFVTRTQSGLVLGESALLSVPEVILLIARGDLTGKVTRQGESDHSGIRVEAAPGVVTFTDAAGTYLFKDLPVGDYLVSAESGSAYAPASASTLTTVLESQAVTAPDIVLQPVPGTITGTVQRAGSGDASGIDVLATGVTVSGTEQSYATVTDSAGVFLLSGITAGTYSLTMSTSQYKTSQQGPLVLSPNETIDIGTVVLDQATGSVAGQVSLSGQSAFDGVRAALSQAGVEQAVTYSDVGGSYRFASVPAGTYTLALSKSGFGTVRVNPVVVQADTLTTVAAQTLSPQVGDVHLVGVTGFTNTTTVQVGGSYPNVNQIRICEVPGVTDPATFTLAQCDYVAVTVLDAASGTFQPLSHTFTQSPCPGPTDPLAICDGAKTIWVRLKDTAGAESGWFEIPVVLDRVPPTGNVVIQPGSGTLSGGVVTDGGAAYTRDLNVAVLVRAEDDRSAVAAGGAVAGVQTVRLFRTPTDANPVVVPMGDGTRMLSGVALDTGSGDGPRSLLLQIEDAAGNLSVTDLLAVSCPDPRVAGVPTDCDSVFLDTTPPSVVAFSIAPVDTSTTGDFSLGAAYVGQATVDLGIDTTLTGLAEDEAVEVTLANDPGFVGSIVQPLSAPRTLLAWVLSSGDGTKTVWIKLRDAAGNVSTVFSDDVILDTVAPDAPVLTPVSSPTYQTQPVLGWGAVAGASSYHLQLSDTRAFDGSGSVLIEQDQSATSFVPAVLADGTYFWRVRALDAAGHQSAYSSVESFTVDTVAPSAPALTGVPALSAQNTPTLTWSYVADAALYEVEVDTASTFDSANLLSATTGGTTWVTPILSDTLWSVRVRALDAAGNQSPWSAVVSMTIDTTAPGAPAPVAPSDGALLAGSTVTPTWTPVTDADHYLLQIATDSAFSTIDERVSSTAQQTLTLQDGTYYWRVGAVDAAGNASTMASAPVRSFTLDSQAPTTPTLASVGSLIATGTPTFSWSDESASGAATYAVEIDGARTTVPGTSYQPSTPLADGAHSITVRAIDAAGNESAPAPIQLFTVDSTAPPAPQLTAVSPDPTSETLIWATFTTSTDATSYLVAWDTDPLFGAPSTQSVSSGSVQLGPLSDGTWYWRVQATDAAGNTSAWSSTDTFVVDTQPPADVALGSPSDGAVLASATVTLSWSAATGASSYLLDLSSSGTMVSYERTAIGATSRTITVADGTWYWRVLAVDAAGNVSPEAGAALRAFTVDTVAPSTPVLVAVSSPTNQTQPVLSWGAVTGASSYNLTLDGTTVATTSTSYTPASALADGTHTWTVTAVDSAGNESAAAPTSSFVVDATPPAAPTLTTLPADPTSDNTPLVGWSTVADADTYLVEWSTDSAFGAASSLTTASTSTTLSALANGLWYWRVRAIDAVGNQSSPSASDSFTVDATAPAAPSPIAPADASVSTTADVAFSWSAVADAVSYRLQVGTDSALNVVTYDVPGITATTKTLHLSDDTWSWRVLAVDAAGNESVAAGATIWSVQVDASAPATPTVTAVSTPSADATPTFTWSDESGSGAVDYQVEIDGVPTAVTATSYTPVSALADGSHTLRVRSRDAAGNTSAWSASQSFVVDTTPPSAAPAALTPADGSTDTTGTLTFDWSDVTDALTAVSYELEIARSSDFATLVLQRTTTLSTDTIALSDGAYVWRVRAVDAAGNSTAWSPAGTGAVFTVDTTAPDAPTAVAVATPATASPTLSWTDESASGAVRYDLQVDSTVTFSSSPLAVDQSVSGTSQSTTLSDGTWYWRVRAVDAAGLTSAWTSGNAFVVDTVPPGPPESLSPGAGSASSSSSVTFSWAAPSLTGADHYLLEVSYDSGFTTLAQQATTSALTHTFAFPDGTYYWRVSAYDAAGNASNPALGGAFTVDTTGPARPDALSPPTWVNGTQSVVTLTWTDESDTGATSYEYQVATDSGFASLLSGTLGTDVVTTTTVDLSTATLSDGTLYWRVRSLDALGNASAWSLVQSFVVDKTLPADSGTPARAPANGAYVASSGGVDLAWSTWTDANGVSYRLEVGQEPTFSNQVVVDTTLSSNQSYQALADGTYYWRVRAIDPAGNQAPPTPAWSFILDRSPPDPTGFHPYPSITSDNTPNLSWNPISDAATYVVSFSTSLDFTSPAQTITLGAGTGPRTHLQDGDFTSPLADGSWYAQVVVQDAAGNQSGPSGTLAFTVDTVTPAAPATCTLTTLLGPGLSSNDPLPELTWTAVSSAKSFTLDIEKWDTSTNPGRWVPYGQVPQIPPADSGLDSYLTLPLDVALADGVIHRFAVSTTDAAGNTSTSRTWCTTDSGGSTYYRLDLTPPSSTVAGVVITSPNPSKTSPPGNLGFSWDRMQEVFEVSANVPAGMPAGGEMGYRAEVLWQDGVTVVAATSVAWAPGLPLAGTRQSATFDIDTEETYFINVVPIDAAGNEGPPLPIPPPWTFDQTAPQTPLAVEPLATTSTAGVTEALRTSNPQPLFAWTDEFDSGATSYTLRIYAGLLSSITTQTPVFTKTTVDTAYMLVASEALADGSYTWTVSASDDAGNSSGEGLAGPSGEPTWIVVDTTAPPALDATTMAPAGGSAVRDGAFAFEVDASNASGTVVYEVWVTDTAGGVLYTKTCELADGTACYLDTSRTPNVAVLTPNDVVFGDMVLRWKVRVLDDLGNGSAFTAPASFTVDDTPPEAPWVDIENGAQVTNKTTLSLALFAGGATKMQISTDGTFDTEPWQAYATSATFTAGSGDGFYTVYVRYRDAAGNVTAAVSDTIEVDTSAPTNPSIQIENGAVVTRDSLVSVTFGASGATKMRYSVDGTFDTEPWVPFAPSANVILPSGDCASGVACKRIDVYFRDEAGNVAGPVSDTIRLDTTPPTVGVSIDAGAAYATSTSVTLSLTADEPVALSIANESQDCSTAFYGALETPPLTDRSWTLDATEGLRSVVVCFQDEAGWTASAVDTIVLDTGLPAVISVAVQEANSDDFVTTSSLNVDVTAADQTSVGTDLVFSVDESRASDCTGAVYAHNFGTCSAAPCTATVPLTIGNTEGDHVVRVCVKDAAGNVSPRRQQTVHLDLQAPVLWSVTLAGGASAVSSRQIAVDLVASDARPWALDGATRGAMRIGEKSNLAGVGWVPYAASTSYTLSGGAGSKTVYAQVRDRAGHESAIVSSSILLSTDAPVAIQLDVLEKKTSNVITATNASQVDVRLIASDSVVPGAQLTAALGWGSLDCTAATYTLAFPASCTTSGPCTLLVSGVTVPGSSAIPPNEGLKKLSACVRNSAGRVTPAAITTSLDYDVTAPEQVFGVNPIPGNTTLSVTWSQAADVPTGAYLGSGVVGYKVEHTLEGVTSSDIVAGASSTSLVYSDLPVRRSVAVRVRAIDAAGNLGPWSSMKSRIPGFRISSLPSYTPDRTGFAPTFAADGENLFVVGRYTTGTIFDPFYSDVSNGFAVTTCASSSADCSNPSAWTSTGPISAKTSWEAAGEIKHPRLPFVTAQGRYWVGATVVNGANTEARLFTCKRGPLCIYASSWSRVDIDGPSANIASEPGFDLAVTKNFLVAAYHTGVAPNIQPRLRFCPLITDCTDPTNWSISTDLVESGGGAPAQQIEIEGDDEYLWITYPLDQTLDTVHTTADLRVMRCDMRSYWIYAHPSPCAVGSTEVMQWDVSCDDTDPLGNTRKANCQGASAKLHGGVFYVALAPTLAGVGRSKNEFAMVQCSASGCSYGVMESVATSEVPTVFDTNGASAGTLTVADGEVHWTRWSKNGEIAYAYCRVGADCSQEAKWTALVLDPFASLATQPAVVGYGTNVGVVWLDGNNRYRIALPRIPSPARMEVGPGMGGFVTSWSPIFASQGTEILYDIHGSPASGDVAIQGDPLIDFAFISAPAGTAYAVATRAYDAQGDVSNLSPARSITVPSTFVFPAAETVDAAAPSAAKLHYAGAQAGTHLLRVWRQTDTFAAVCDTTKQDCSVDSSWATSIPLPMASTGGVALTSFDVAASTNFAMIVGTTITNLYVATCRWSTGCDQDTDWTVVTLGTAGSVSAPHIAMDSNHAYVLARHGVISGARGKEDLDLYGCDWLSTPDCSSAAGWTFTAVTTGVSNSVAFDLDVRGNYVAMARADTYQVDYYQCYTSSNCTTIYSKTKLVATSTNLQPNSVSIRMDSKYRPRITYVQDAFVYLLSCTSYPSYCRYNTDRYWGQMAIRVVSTATGTFTHLAYGPGDSTYVYYAGASGPNLAVCASECSQPASWSEVNLAQLAGIAEPAAGGSVFSMSATTGDIFGVYAADGTNTPTLFWGAQMNP